MVDALFVGNKNIVEYENVLLINRNRDSITVRLFRGVDFEIYEEDAVHFIEGYFKYVGHKYAELGYIVPELDMRYDAL